MARSKHLLRSIKDMYVEYGYTTQEIADLRGDVTKSQVASIIREMKITKR